jgi:hypothetical protein
MPENADPMNEPPTPRPLVGRSSDDDWYLVEGAPDASCAAAGDARRAIRYPGPRAAMP